RSEGQRGAGVRPHGPALRARDRRRLPRPRDPRRRQRARAAHSALASVAAGGRRMSRRTYGRLARAAEIAVPIAILVAWQLWTAHAHSLKFPRLSTILVDFRKQWLFAEFGTHVVPSLERIGFGFAIGVLVGVLLGVPLGLSPLLRKIAMPHIEYWRAMPPPALLPISIVLLRSIGNSQKVAFIAFFCLFPVLLNTVDAVRGIDPTLVDTARAFRVSWRERIRRVVLPAALPQIMAGMRNSLALAVIMM